MMFHFPDLLSWTCMFILGASGYGKSTLLKNAAFWFTEYGGRVVYFDLYKSCKVATEILGGMHINPGEIRSYFAPLQTLTTEKAVEFFVLLCRTQGVEITHFIRSAIHDAVLLVKSQDRSQQTLSGLIHFVSDPIVKNALEVFTIHGVYPLFDATKDKLDFSNNWICIEMKDLIDTKDLFLAVLFYLTARIESLVDNVPTALVLDDAAKMVDSPDVRQWIKISMNNFRKRNISFWFAFHTAGFDTDIWASIISACRLRIYTPNPKILSDELTRVSYQKIGLTPLQMKLINSGQKCREYLIQNETGQTQLIDMILKPSTRAILGGSSIGSISLFESLCQQHGRDEAIKQYLSLKGVKNETLT